MDNKEYKDWYSPGEIHFTQQQAIWLIQNLDTLRNGQWPQEVSSYIDIQDGGRSASRRAPFATPVEYAAEIESRMERAGIDGLILLAMECWEESEESLSNYLKIPVWRIRKKSKMALRYIASGPVRRWLGTGKRSGKSYKEFKGKHR